MCLNSGIAAPRVQSEQLRMGSHSRDVSSDDPTAGDDPSVPVFIRAQLLATEHWGLLAARGTAQSEVLTRIAKYFMASAFDDRLGSMQTYYFFLRRRPGLPQRLEDSHTSLPELTRTPG
jgi:hypothetical protein